MAQMKEQNKTPENELNEMEISNLSDAQFKTMVIKMLPKVIGYFNSTKKAQATGAERTHVAMVGPRLAECGTKGAGSLTTSRPWGPTFAHR